MSEWVDAAAPACRFVRAFVSLKEFSSKLLAQERFRE
jgi:hypothetical protein